MGGNQHKPNPSVVDLEPHIRRYWQMRLDDKKILRLLLDHNIDTAQYGLGITRFREMRESLGIIRSTKQDHTVASIQPAMVCLRAQYPNAGAREIVSLLFHEENMGVPRFHIGPMPPPKMGTHEYEVPKVAILRSMARIGSFRRSPPKLCHVHPPPTPENNPLPLAPAKSSNPLSVAHICGSMLPKSQFKRASIGPATVQYILKSKNPSGSP
ncbi:hypothetical protein C8J57DRAFT_1243863 [Mycena rebaudengoi]|nr:hypothetical protein C8J57DRAFT_1243863 [Mycena rebaudengoi]